METEFKEFHHLVKVEYKAIASLIIGALSTILVAWILGVPFGNVMKLINKSFWYHFIPFMTSSIFFVLLVYKSRIQGVKGLGFLSSAVLVNGISEFLFMISSPSGSVFQRQGNILATLGDLAFPIAVVLIYLHIELTEKTRPGLLHAVLILGTAVPMIAGEVIILILEKLDIFIYIAEQINKVVLVYLGIFAVIVIWISIFGFRIMYGTLKHSDDKQVARASMFMLVGFSSLMTNLALLGVGYSSVIRDKPLLFQNSEFTIYNTWLLTSALIILLMAYIFNPSFAYAIPFDVFQLLVIHAEQGITLFSFINEIRDEKGVAKAAALQSPALLAITSLVKEVANTNSTVINIKFDEDKEIIFSNYKSIVSVLITQQNSYFLSKGLDGFTRQFYHQFEDNIENFMGNVGVFEEATLLLRKELPFMRHEFHE